jgi:hypothetical protein
MFFNKTHTQQQCFWRYLFETTHQLDVVTDPRNAPVMDWGPESSNCPDLQESVSWVVSRLPLGTGRDAAGQVFVGRVLHGQVNAMTWARGSAAGIEVTVQFSNVIVAYLDALRSFLRALREGTATLMRPEVATSRDRTLTSLQEELIDRVWERLEQDRAGWQDASRLAPVTAVAARSEAGDGTTTGAHREERVADVERFAVAHELAHLLLGHRSDGVAVDDALQLAVREVITECGIDLTAVTASQREELEADGFAFLLCSGAMLDEPDFVSTYRALVAGHVALLAAGHVNDTLVQIRADGLTHPDLLLRQQLLSGLVHRVSAASPPRPDGQHPVVLLIQLEAFITVALQAQLRRLGSPAYSPPSLANIVRGVYEGVAAFGRSFESSTDQEAAATAQAATRQRISELMPHLSEPREANPGHWAVALLDQVLRNPTGVCIHLRDGRPQTIFLSAWERHLRCEACWTQHGFAEKIRDASGRPPNPDPEEHTCDRCRRHAPGELEAVLARIGIWVLTIGLCPDCTQEAVSDT